MPFRSFLQGIVCAAWLGALAACTAKQEAPVPNPKITSFAATAPRVPLNLATTLTAVFSEGTGTIDQGIGTIQSGVAVSTGPIQATKNFTLTVTNSKGIQTTASTTVTPMAFAATGSLANRRVGHSATLLNNGKVLVAGGENDDQQTLASAELYDPATGTFTPTGTMTAPREFHSATLLANGKVLIVGGYDSDGDADLSSAELYDPATGQFQATGGLLYGVGLELHTATLLTSGSQAGKVLVAGGYSSDLEEENLVAQLYDPATGRFALHAPMVTPRSGHLALPLAGGKILFTGGYSTVQEKDLASAEVYDPASGSGKFLAVGSMSSARYGALAAVLPSGKVLVAGGEHDGVPLASSEIFDPANGQFCAGPAMAASRSMPLGVALPGGMVLVCGGYSTDDTVLATAEILDPTTNTFKATAALAAPRAVGASVLLAGGNLLLLGGHNGGNVLQSAELFR
jgi:hypothetical protein